MPPPDAHASLCLAIAALERGDNETAISEAKRALQHNRNLATGATILGIALSRSGKADLAKAALKQAFKIEPNNPRHGYNLAVHLLAAGDDWAARTAVSEALKDDPDFGPGKTLLERIDSQQREDPLDFIVPLVPPSPDPSIAAHGLPFMAGMEKPWTTIGWIFTALAVVAATCMVIYRPFVDSAPTETAKAAFALRPGPGPMFSVFMLTISGICSIMWVLIDLVDRKFKLVWIVPTIVCCTCGFHCVPQTLYMFMRRD